MATVSLSSSANAATTVTPTEPAAVLGDPDVVRDSSVDINVDVAGRVFYRSSASAAFAAQSSTDLATVNCLGDQPGGNSPRTTVTVTAPDSSTVLTAMSPARDVGVLGRLNGSPPLNPQPTNPANNIYRGDFTNGSTHGLSATLDLTGKPAGVYTVTTTTINKVKTGSFGLGSCATIGTPGPGNTIVPGPVIETDTFEYRPWTYSFTDILGNDEVQANFDPTEAQFSLGDKRSPIFGGYQDFYSLDLLNFALPSDPVTCATDPSTCLPLSASPCEPGTGCTPRLMIMTKALGLPYGIQGIFDLETKAFIAMAVIDGRKKTIFSLGTTNDAYYSALISSLTTQFASQGNDLQAILGTQVEINTGSSSTTFSLLNGLQLDPSTSPGGINIRGAGSVQAGVLLDVYSHLRTSGPACAPNSASSAAGDTSYVHNEDAGYTVQTSPGFPRVPRVGPLGAIVGGPVYSIFGDFTGSTTPLVNTASAVIGVDTANDEPNGYPVWIQPFLSSPMHVANAKTMDYLGTATWSASETPLLGGCLSVNFMLGTGVAIFDNPLSYGFDDLVKPFTAPNAALDAIMNAVDSAVTTVIDQVTTNPVVGTVLTDIIGTLPLSDLPG